MNGGDRGPGRHPEEPDELPKKSDDAQKLEGALGLIDGIFNRGKGGGTVDVPQGKTIFFDLSYNFAAAICYFPMLLCVVAPALWLYSEPKENEYLRFHSVQALMLFAAMIVLQTLIGTVASMFKILPGTMGIAFPILLRFVAAGVGFAWTLISLKQMLSVYKKREGRLFLLADQADNFV